MCGSVFVAVSVLWGTYNLCIHMRLYESVLIRIICHLNDVKPLETYIYYLYYYRYKHFARRHEWLINNTYYKLTGCEIDVWKAENISPACKKQKYSYIYIYLVDHLVPSSIYRLIKHAALYIYIYSSKTRRMLEYRSIILYTYLNGNPREIFWTA